MISKKIDDGQDPRPLITWHDSTHDQASYTNLQALVALIAAMRRYGFLDHCES